MFKQLIGVLIICSSLMVGCGFISRSCTHYTGEMTYKCSKVGTEYAQSDSGLAVLLDKDGKPVACK